MGAQAAGDNHTPLHEAAANNDNPEVLKILLEAGGDPNIRDGDGATLLYWAARNENPAVVKVLLDAKADVAAPNENGFLPQQQAAWGNNNPEVLKVLLKAGADLAARTDDDRTLLHLAAQANGNPHVIEALLGVGAKLEARTDNGTLPLGYAAWGNQNPAVIKALLEAGARLRARRRNGNTSLHDAAWNNGNPAVIRVLVEAGARLGARNQDGDKALHVAARRTKNPDVVLVLLEADNDPMAENGEGKTPWDLAQDNEAFKGSDAYWRLNEARFESPGQSIHRSPATRRESAGKTAAPTTELDVLSVKPSVPAAGPGCQIPGYPSPDNPRSLGLPWCPSSVDFQARVFALQAAGAWCAIATGSSSTPDQIEARHREINAACDTLQAFGVGNCQCPADFRP